MRGLKLIRYWRWIAARATCTACIAYTVEPVRAPAALAVALRGLSLGVRINVSNKRTEDWTEDVC